jgi:hypothetical protein
MKHVGPDVLVERVQLRLRVETKSYPPSFSKNRQIDSIPR